jgi:hypothetical protein
MSLEIHLRIVGACLLMLATLNFVLPKRFNWKAELARLSLINRRIFTVHCVFIALLLVLMGLLSLFYAGSLLEPTPLSRAVLLGLTLFWGTRLYAQWFIYDVKLWWGQTFNTVVHIVFSGLWIYTTAVFGWAWWTVL